MWVNDMILIVGLGNYGIEYQNVMLKQLGNVILADNIENANIKMLVDHHRVADFKTSEPVYMFSEPVGCTGTILYRLYKTQFFI